MRIEKMDTNFQQLVEQCRDIGVQVRYLEDFGYYWFINSDCAAPSRIFDTEQDAWEAAARWFFTGVEFTVDGVGASI
jgi:hypothetical protein